jgi:hypothetical protein
MAAPNIKNEEVVRLVKELANREGKSMTAVVAEAVQEKLARDYKAAINEERMRYILGLVRQVREHMERVNPEWLAKDPTHELYDESGLPK